MSLNVTPTLPPLDGSLTLPEVAHYNLLHNPTQPFFIFSDDEHPNEIVTISHLEFARASCRAARAVLPGSGPGDVVAIIALIDNIAYHAIIVGLMHAGLVPFPISSRNSPAAIVHLLRKTSSHRILTTPGTLNTLMDGITAELAAGEAEYPVHIDTVPDLQQLYPKLGMESADDSFDAYITGPRPALHDIAMYMHSSGSTGFPKPIPETHEALIEWAAILPHSIRSLPSAHSLRLSGMGLPPFHSMGFVIQLLCPLFGLTCAATFPPVVNTPTAQPHPPSSNYVLEHLKRTHSNAMLIVPALLQGLGAEKEGVEVMKDFVFVGYGGGPLPHQLGDSLAAAGVNIQALYGTTEIGGTAVIRMELDPMEWDLMQFSERTKMRWVLQDDGTYEAQYLTCDSHHPSVENIKDTRGYATSDLFVQHPTKKNLWRIVSRIDDVIIHSSGEKTVPAPMEDIMNSSPLIRGVVMFGREHDQSGVLIEPVQELQIDVRNQQEVSELRNRLWPVVEQANEAAPAFSRIFKEMVLITSPNILGTRNLIDMARSGPHASTVRFLYTSSIASAQSWDHHNEPYPEEVVYDANTAVGGGYGESKYVAERILAKSNLCATSLRLGQISGGMPNGSWATSDWLPILIKSSLAMGVLPVAGGVISWLPMDVAAQVILDVGYSADSPSMALNLVHPKPITWECIIGEIRNAMASSSKLTVGSIPLVSFGEWHANLENHARDASEEDLKHIPAIKLIDFFREMGAADHDILKEGRIDSESGGLANLRTDKTQNISCTLRELPPLGAEDAQRWITYWKNVGFFE
ncbi:hypothetical protein BDQ12DRAFT_715644 [Crucibulum laeve]|uniref:AMP-dependent synthetase/ligase domain-containing protein n=1 Tax=Crucibulum laeve TaxID=68775 RepID=A0A5C3LMI6_9AGAR|nr:hypothetical protein BDQ12DRAFT_715644 [Crucibulum laeve]